MQPQLKEDLHPRPHSFHPVILREYDLRGIIGQDLFPEDAYFIGLAFGTFIQRDIGGKKIYVGYDGRETSPAYADLVAKGLSETGCTVQIIECGPTPMLNFALYEYEADGAIMVTGSHNPADFNGFKLLARKKSIHGEIIQDIAKLAENGDYESGEGSIAKTNVQEAYIERLLKDFQPGRALKIAWDCGNGATGNVIKALTSKLPGEHILLFEEIDGTFPNHPADPTKEENLEDLQNTVIKNKCDAGLGFDGDGDRFGVIDGKGNFLEADKILALYAKEILEKHPGAAIIGDVKCSKALYDEVQGLGGKASMSACGHSRVKAKMTEENAILAGELSGHIFFKDHYYGFDDAIYCAIRLMNIMGRSEAMLSGMLSHLPKTYATPEIRFDACEKEKFLVPERLAEKLGKNKDYSFEINTIDGVRASTKEGWILLRTSNTQAMLSARVEAETPEALEKLKKLLKNEMHDLGYKIPI